MTCPDCEEGLAVTVEPGYTVLAESVVSEPSDLEMRVVEVLSGNHSGSYCECMFVDLDRPCRACTALGFTTNATLEA